MDGVSNTSGPGLNAGLSLSTPADLYVGGSPAGNCLAGTLEFVRIALGTLADAKTTIEELYAWQFNGPFLSDWNGRESIAGKRAAGAIDLAEHGKH